MIYCDCIPTTGKYLFFLVVWLNWKFGNRFKSANIVLPKPLIFERWKFLFGYIS